MQAFITQPAMRSGTPDPSDTPADNKIDPISFTDALGGYRGFDFFKANGYTVIHFIQLNPRMKRSSGSGIYTTPISY